MNNDVVVIQLDRPRQLNFNYTALKTLVELSGQTIEEIDQRLDVSDFEFLEQMVYCALLKDARENNETLTLDQIPKLLDGAPTFAHIIEKVISAWRVTFGGPPAPPVPEGNTGKPPSSADQPETASRSTGKKQKE